MGDCNDSVICDVTVNCVSQRNAHITLLFSLDESDAVTFAGFLGTEALPTDRVEPEALESSAPEIMGVIGNALEFEEERQRETNLPVWDLIFLSTISTILKKIGGFQENCYKKITQNIKTSKLTDIKKTGMFSMKTLCLIELNMFWLFRVE